jgi:hypothetical protein
VITCRINTTEGYSWHTSHNQLNLIVDLIHNSYITWEKRQDELDQKFERLNKEYQQTNNKISKLDNKINLIILSLEEINLQQNKTSKNSDYIKEEATFIRKELNYLPNKNNLEFSQVQKDPYLAQVVLETKKLVEEVKTLIFS